MRRNPYRPAAWFAYLSGLVHLVAPFVSDFSRPALALALFGAVWIVLGALLVRLRSRLFAWLVYVAALGGIVVAAGGVGYPEAVAPWIFQAILAADIGIALSLFVLLWRGRRAA